MSFNSKTDSRSSSKKTFQKNVGDWICADKSCKNLNFARRTSCNRCNKEKEQSSSGDSSSKKKIGTEIGKVIAEKSRGLFSADDWSCVKCLNVNWARRSTCNLCNSAKFTDNSEERTGYGGGYLDRGVVEYKERVESSDDEYDEFGRRKKRRDEKRKNDRSRHASRSRSRSKDRRRSPERRRRDSRSRSKNRRRSTDRRRSRERSKDRRIQRSRDRSSRQEKSKEPVRKIEPKSDKLRDLPPENEATSSKKEFFEKTLLDNDEEEEDSDDDPEILAKYSLWDDPSDEEPIKSSANTRCPSKSPLKKSYRDEPSKEHVSRRSKSSSADRSSEIYGTRNSRNSGSTS